MLESTFLVLSTAEVLGKTRYLFSPMKNIEYTLQRNKYRLWTYFGSAGFRHFIQNWLLLWQTEATNR